MRARPVVVKHELSLLLGPGLATAGTFGVGRASDFEVRGVCSRASIADPLSVVTDASCATARTGCVEHLLPADAVTEDTGRLDAEVTSCPPDEHGDGCP